MRKINPELWLVLFLIVIAAVLNFLVASQRMALVFYFLPTLYSALSLWPPTRHAHRGCQRGAGGLAGLYESGDLYPPRRTAF